MSKKPVARKLAQKLGFYPGPSTARHDSSGRARAATSARRAARHDFYRPARPLTPSPSLSPDQTLSFLSVSHNHDPQSHLGMATGRGRAGLGTLSVLAPSPDC
jgi:hypothetical protein